MDTPSGTDDRAPGDPAGSFERLRRDRPVLYAARHLVGPVGKAVLAVLGIGAALGALVPSIGLDGPRTWLRDTLSWVPDPLGWLFGGLVARMRGLFAGVSVSGGVEEVARTARWVVPILVAVAIAIREVRARRFAGPDTTEPSATDEEPPE